MSSGISDAVRTWAGVCSLVGVAIIYPVQGGDAATFQSPVDSAKRPFGQPYACKGKLCLFDDKYHTGMDIRSDSDKDIWLWPNLDEEGKKALSDQEKETLERVRTVKAIAPGTVHLIQMKQASNNSFKNNANHCMGNIVVIYHDRRFVSLYAHLDKIDDGLRRGMYISAGTKIGVYGNTGKEGDCDGIPGPDGPFPEHLHLELKAWGVMGSLADHGGLTQDLDGDGVPEQANFWGYTPNHPNLHGYINPYPYIFDQDIDNIEDIEPTVISVADASSVYTGPNPEQAEPEFEEYASFATAVDGQRFVALSRHAEWYQIYFPSYRGPATGWVRGTETAGNVVEVFDPGRTQLQAGVNLRAAPSAASGQLNRVWDDQLLVQSGSGDGDGCSRPWYGVYLIDGTARGWVCGEFIVEHDCRNLLTSDRPVPEGFGAAYNVFSDAQKLWLRSSSCSEGQPKVIAGQQIPTQWIYKYGHQWTGRSWEQFELSGSQAIDKEGNVLESWFEGEAHADLDIAATDLEQNKSVSAYVCTWTGSEWKCGCRDATCEPDQGTGELWQLQKFSRE